MTEAIAPHPSPGSAVASNPSLAEHQNGPVSGPDELIALLHRAARETAGLEVIYEALDVLARRFGLHDALLSVADDTAGTQVFRLGHRSIGPAELDRLGPEGFASDPDTVPSVARRLVSGIAEMALATQAARHHLVRDPLTGLHSLDVFNEALRAAAAQSSRYGWTFSVMALRMPVPDGQRGEPEIRRIGRAFARALRSGDTGARLHQGTFVALLPSATAESLHALVRRFSEESGAAVAGIRFASATAPNDSVDPAELFRLAGARLHED
ncbi:MAG: GGDEF domain-containing protein [Acidimicrobiales bacterium]